jgi:hypothetical protein
MSENPGNLQSSAGQGGIQLPGGELTVPSEPEQHFAIRHSDWRQIRRKLVRIKNPAPSIAAVAWTSVGVAAGALVAYLPWSAAYSQLPATAQLHYSYISPLLAILAIAAIVLAVILFVIDHSMKRLDAISIDSVLEDMDEIYAPYAIEAADGAATAPNARPKLTLGEWIKSMPLWSKDH